MREGKWLYRWRRWLYLGLMVAYFLWNFTLNPEFQLLFAGLLLLAVLLAFAQCSWRNQMLGLVLFCLGAGCLWWSGASWQQWVGAFSANGGLVVLFITLPLFSIILSFNDFLNPLNQLLVGYVSRNCWFFSLTAVLAGLLGSVLNVGGITLMHELLQPYAHRYGDERQLAQALSRGNLAMSYWAPCHMSVATVVTYTGISWLELVPKGLALSFLQLLLICLSFYWGGGKAGRCKLATNPGGLKRLDWGILLQLLAIYAGLIFLVGMITWQTQLPILAIISLVALIYPLGAALLLHKGSTYRLGWQTYYNQKLPSIVNQVLLFSTVGFFGKALELSGVGQLLIGSLHLETWTSPYLLTAGIALAMLVLSLTGIHPLVCMIALATTLKAEVLGITPLSLAYTYLLGYSVGVIVSPFSAVALTLSALNGRDPWNGLGRHNLLYGILLILVFSLLIPFL